MIKNIFCSPNKISKQDGFTLLELLIVLVILSSTALVAVSTLTDDMNQTRFNDTKNRIAMVKRAIIGDAARSLNGEPVISGFFADMGRLPGCIEELIKQEDCSGTALPGWVMTNIPPISSGWRGPYLSSFDGVFEDGWGNDDGVDQVGDNFGWDYNNTGNQVILKSSGLDARDGPAYTPTPADEQAAYSMEYPPEINAGNAFPIIDTGDAFIDMNTTMFRVELTNNTAGTIALSADTVCLFAYYQNGTATLAPAPISAGNASAITISPGSSEVITFNAIGAATLIPMGTGAIQLSTYTSGSPSTCNGISYNSLPLRIKNILPKTVLPELRWSLI
jgi:prepilin-type N-terminal cleavage/methylation domain-containing protein